MNYYVFVKLLLSVMCIEKNERNRRYTFFFFKRIVNLKENEYLYVTINCRKSDKKEKKK